MGRSPAAGAATAGHVWQFLTLAPGYGGSVELRAPFAFLPGLWGGGAIAFYQAVSIPCLIAAALLAVWLVARMRALGHSRLARAVRREPGDAVRPAAGSCRRAARRRALRRRGAQ